MFRAIQAGHHPTHGFRFSLRDGIAIIASVALAWFCWRPLGEFALIFPITLGHFFLFCNTFRVGRYFELAWAGIFVVNVAAWVLAGQFAWAHVLWVQTPVTLAGITMALCSRNYQRDLQPRRTRRRTSCKHKPCHGGPASAYG